MKLGLFLISAIIVMWWVGLVLILLNDATPRFIIGWLVMSLGFATLFLILSIIDLERR